jgi:hypothetical protein
MGKDTEHMDGDLMERNALWMRFRAYIGTTYECST